MPLQEGTAADLMAQRVTKVTGVEVDRTEAGLELILETAAGSEKLVPLILPEGNNLVIEVLDATLDLPNKNEFRQVNPVAGIEEVRVTQIDAASIRVTITGNEQTPSAEIVPSSQNLVLSVSPQAQAQTEAAESIEVIVTAEKREENVQDIPSSITVLGEQELEDAGVNSLNDIAGNTPNLSLFSFGDSRYFNNYSIRGLSNFNFLSRDAAGFFVDDVPYDYGSFLDVDLLDLARVEVLRGPQSTLYGRNAQAGVVNIITRKPTNDFEFKTLASYGEFDDLDFQASVNAPLVEDNLFLRLSGGYANRDGYIDNTFLDRNIGGQQGGSGRARLLWTPNPNWEVAINAAFDDYDDDAPVLLLDTESNITETEQDFDGFNRLNSNTQSLKVSYDNDNFRFTSITARRFSDQETRFDGDSTTADLIIGVSDFDSTVFSQELRLQSSNPEQFQWLVGGYFEARDFNATGEGLIFGNDLPPQAGFPGRSRTDAEIDQDTYAIFGQGSYQLTKAFSLTAGLRYEAVNNTLENRDRIFELADGSGMMATATSLSDIYQDDDQLLPRFALEYVFTSDAKLYGSIARGYKPSGINYRAENESTIRFDTESSWNYELGLKTSWLKDRLTASFAFFHTDVSDYQVALLNEVGLQEEITNAEVSITGFEFETKAIPAKGFEVIAGLGISDTNFDEYTNPLTGQDFSDNKLPFAPGVTYNLALQYRHPQPQGIFARVELQGAGETFFDDANTIRQGSFAIVNTRLGYEFENFGTYLFVNNLFGTEYITNGYDLTSLGTTVVSYGAPSTIGVQIKAEF